MNCAQKYNDVHLPPIQNTKCTLFFMCMCKVRTVQQFSRNNNKEDWSHVY